MGRGANCSWIGPGIPLSSQIFRAIKNELWLFLILAGLTVILLGVFLEEVGSFIRHISSSRQKQLYLWILGMYLVFAVNSLIALYVPRSSSLCNFIASLYHSITLLKFMGLITDFFGGKGHMLAVLSGQQVSPDPFPCCCCCCLPLVAINRYAADKSLHSLSGLIVSSWAGPAPTTLEKLKNKISDNHLLVLQVDSVNPNLYVNGIICVSTFVSFYGHLLFYKATMSALHGYGLRAKFICIIVVLVLCGLQSGILETMGALEVIPCTPPFSVLTRSQLIYHYCVIVEMFCIGLYACHTFREVELSVVEDVEGPVGVWQMEKAVQTDDGQMSGWLSEEAWPSRYLVNISNPSYNSNEDSLCRIEHAPLDGFPFPQARSQQSRRPEPVDPSSAEEPGVDLSHITVRVDINYQDSEDVTVV
ncbi:organic solute transporter subunit alpha [Chaetodon trifascialis]|uniref:organic solute transporter subunit alpha n=1 Tax=Chaetodon trifascialis TaxID=109706 RepID=UPI0039954F65